MPDELARGIALHAGDCLDVLAELPADHFDSCVCDPPYHLVSIVKRFGAPDAAPARPMRNGGAEFQRLSRGFMNQTWDGGDIAFRAELWRAVFRVLKPGAHLCAFGGTRTYHRLACAIEDAGFDIRDQIAWINGQGFPKSRNVSKAIDRELGAERDKKRFPPRPESSGTFLGATESRAWIEQSRVNGYHEVDCDVPVTEAAAQWVGWGTALKPALEPIALARKPLGEATVAANVLKWGTGAINVEGCRIAFGGDDDANESKEKNRHGDFGTGPRNNLVYGKDDRNRGNYNPPGRWPANLCHDGSDEVVAAFPDAGGGHWSGETPSLAGRQRAAYDESFDLESGSAARFFYTAKADIEDRLGSGHPTVKPLDLMQWLIRLVTPPGGLVLDPFAGTGTTGEAAWREGMRAALIEREPAYCADIRRRLELRWSSLAERRRQAHKETQKTRPLDNQGTLFA